jgi:hypothetical protein
MKLINVPLKYLITFWIILVTDSFASAHDFECMTSDPGLPTYDVHYSVDTVHAVAIWAVTDSATWLNAHPDCEELLPQSYEMPDFAESLWDSTFQLSISRFYLDNSNHKHWVTAATPTAPNNRIFAHNEIWTGFWDEWYITRALNYADPYVDFRDHDHNSDGWIDCVLLFDYFHGGSGIVSSLDSAWKSTKI